MFNYNVINPVNIHYSKYQGAKGTSGSDENKNSITPDKENEGQKKFPNGNRVAIDYTKNKINISQVLQDFRSTIAAINSPEDVVKEVEAYLELVGKESNKELPSRDIVLSNLKNAARVTDKYIQDSLKKPSKVVQDWVDALFLQNVNLKADPNEINEDFRVRIPDKKQPQTPAEFPPQQATVEHTGGLAPLKEDTVSITGNIPVIEQENNVAAIEEAPVEEAAAQNESVLIEADVLEKEIEEQVQKEEEIKTSKSAFDPVNEDEKKAKDIVFAAKAVFDEGGDLYSALKLYDEAIELMQKSDNANLKSAIFFERAKIFDSYDYPELALIDYNKATKCQDNNLKAQAHIKMGNIYDDYVQFEPAMDQYERAIETSEEINNYQGKTRALRYIASMFVRMYDTENTEIFTELAMESAKESNAKQTIANTYLEAAENYKYIGEDSKALHIYKELAQEETLQDDYETMAKNYMEASILMDKKGNKQKAYALMQKSKDFQRRAKLKALEA